MLLFTFCMFNAINKSELAALKSTLNTHFNVDTNAHNTDAHCTGAAGKPEKRFRFPEFAYREAIFPLQRMRCGLWQENSVVQLQYL